jgi:hypothetical protein
MKIDPELIKYFKRCLKFVNFDINEYIKMTQFSIKYYRGDAKVRNDLSPFHDLEKKWYESLDKGEPEYQLYNENAFLCDVWACWIVYSKKYLTAIQKNVVLSNKQLIIDYIGKINSIVDLGNGCGKTTEALKCIFPEAMVYGTNYPGSTQYKVASIAGKESGFKMHPSANQINNAVDIVFASEYFEHFEDPVAHLEEVNFALDPKFFILANAFTSKAFGHFDFYKYNGKTIKNTEMSKIFNNTLKSYGFEQIKTNCWNNRPAIWHKKLKVKKGLGIKL